MLYWITGLAGAGKSTIGKALYDELKPHNPALVLLDGDELRSVLGEHFGYTADERYKCSMVYSRLCKMLTEQGLDIICCVCSMFDDVRQFNRDNIDDYVEIFINPPLDVIKERNQKGLYTDDEAHVYGVNITPELPASPDITLVNDGSISIGEQVKTILKEVHNENTMGLHRPG